MHARAQGVLQPPPATAIAAHAVCAAAGNPTNIIVATAYRFSFLDYSKWMGLPTIGARMVLCVWGCLARGASLLHACMARMCSMEGVRA
jgi:hypothetical protein